MIGWRDPSSCVAPAHPAEVRLTDLATLFDGPVTDRPVRIRRRRDEPAVLLSEQDLRSLLSRRGFTPQVYSGQDVLVIWLPDLALWGRGGHFGDARDDLLDEIDQLLFSLEQHAVARQVPSVVARLPWIHRLSAARDDAERVEILFAEPEPPADGDVR